MGSLSVADIRYMLPQSSQESITQNIKLLVAFLLVLLEGKRLACQAFTDYTASTISSQAPKAGIVSDRPNQP